MSDPNLDRASDLDPVTVSVISNRVDAIVREMSNTLLRSARSTVIASARDFSCTLVTADNRLSAATDGIPVHVFGSDIQTQSMCDLHEDLAEGDAFLHNDPYLGNTHAADQTILIPVFVDGEHLFTACAKAHQADIGNSIPSTYHAAARDIYEEGALVFPCVRVQQNYDMIDDVIRLCRGADPRSGSMVWRFFRHPRLGPNRRTSAQGALRQIRCCHDQSVRGTLARLFRVPHRSSHSQVAKGACDRLGCARPDPTAVARWDPD